MDNASVHPGAEDGVVELLRQAAELFVVGDVAGGRLALDDICGATIVSEPIVLVPVKPPGRYELAGGPGTEAPSVTTQAMVFARDRYRCLYCGRRTVFLQVVNLLSHAFPGELPRHPHWKKEETHRLFWDLTTTIDHVHPVSRGGAIDDPENLATVCTRCQYQKSNRTLESLGWERREPGPQWDGLTGLYAQLWSDLGRPAGAHCAWLTAIQGAEETADTRPAK